MWQREIEGKKNYLGDQGETDEVHDETDGGHGELLPLAEHLGPFVEDGHRQTLDAAI